MSEGVGKKPGRVADSGQQMLFELDEVTVEGPRRRLSEESFLDDSPRGLRIGEERLETYLLRTGQSWVVRLRKELEQVEYRALMVGSSHRGRKRLHPRTMVGLIVYGMLQRQWALRDLEALTKRDVGAWWICGGHQPDHSTIGKFIADHAEVLSEEFFTELLGRVVRRVRMKRGTIAGDGTVVEAAAGGIKRLRAEAARERAEQARREAAKAAEDEKLRAKAEQAEEVAQAVEERTRQRKSHGRDAEKIGIAPSEPSAVVQPLKDGRYRPSYKPSIWVHESGLIVGQAVDPSSETAVVEDLKEQHEKIFGAQPITTLLDAGFNALDVIESLQNTDLLCPGGRDGAARKSTSGKYYSKHRFTYDVERDVYRCPAGEELVCVGAQQQLRGGSARKYRTSACQQCPQHSKCTTSAKGRSIWRYEREELREALAQVMEQPAARKKYRQRAPLSEGVFSVLKDRQGLRRFHRRGERGVRVEFALHCIAFDLGKIARRGSGPLVLAAQAHFRSDSCPSGLSVAILCVVPIGPADSPSIRLWARVSPPGSD
jgi:transposase